MYVSSLTASILCLMSGCLMCNIEFPWCLLVMGPRQTLRHTLGGHRPGCVSQGPASGTTTWPQLSKLTDSKSGSLKIDLNWFSAFYFLGKVNFPLIMAAIIAQLTRAKRERANKKTYEPNKVESPLPTTMFLNARAGTNKLKCQFFPPTRLTLDQKLHQSGTLIT